MIRSINQLTLDQLDEWSGIHDNLSLGRCSDEWLSVYQPTPDENQTENRSTFEFWCAAHAEIERRQRLDQ